MRVLLVKLSSMGDVIHTLPALTDAYKNIPDIKFTWLVEQGFQEIAQWHPAVEKVIPVTLRKRQFKNIWSAIKAIRAESYDLVIDAQGLIKSALAAKLSRSDASVGYDNNSIREPIASLLYKDKFAIAKDQHAIPRIRQLFAKALGYELSNDIGYGIDWQAITTSQIQNKPYLVFLHGTTWESKHWPNEYWVQLANLAAQFDFEVQVTWATEQQKARANMLAQHCPNVRKLPHLTINQAASVLYNSDGVVAVDTGFAHLSAAIGKPLVTIYGATDVNKAGTLGNNNINLSSQFKCAPCSKRICTFKNSTGLTPACYQEISPQLVWQKLTTLLTNKL